MLPSEVQEYLTEDRKRFVVVSLEEAGNLTPQERYVRQLYLRLKLIGQRSSQNGDSTASCRGGATSRDSRKLLENSASMGE